MAKPQRKPSRMQRLWHQVRQREVRVRFARNAWEVIMEVNGRLGEQHVFLLASGIAFNILLCLLPLLLVALYVAGKVVDVNSFVEAVHNSMLSALPQVEWTNKLIDTIVNEIRYVQGSSSTAGIVGIGVLMWTSSALFSSLRTGLNAIFNIPTPKFFLWYKLKDLFFTIIIALLILASVLLMPTISLLNSKALGLSPDGYDAMISNTMALVINTGSAFILFFFLLRFVPNKPQPLFIITTATITSVVLWESARFIFTWYLNHIASFGRFYGTFTVLVVAAIWIYYSTLIMLVSAEVAEYAYERRKRGVVSDER